MHMKAYYIVLFLSPEPPHRRLLLVRARAYQVAVQFFKEVVRSDRRARAAARCIVNNTISLNCTYNSIRLEGCEQL